MQPAAANVAANAKPRISLFKRPLSIDLTTANKCDHFSAFYRFDQGKKKNQGNHLYEKREAFIWISVAYVAEFT